MKLHYTVTTEIIATPQQNDIILNVQIYDLLAVCN